MLKLLSLNLFLLSIFSREGAVHKRRLQSLTLSSVDILQTRGVLQMWTFLVQKTLEFFKITARTGGRGVKAVRTFSG